MVASYIQRQHTDNYIITIITLNKHAKLSEQQEIPCVVAIDTQNKFYTRHTYPEICGQ